MITPSARLWRKCPEAVRSRGVPLPVDQTDTDDHEFAGAAGPPAEEPWPCSTPTAQPQPPPRSATSAATPLNNGLLIVGYRYYNPTWGRFTQPDPTNQERNPYAYAQSDPINNSDPTGAQSVDPCLGVNLGAISVAAGLLTGGVGLIAAFTTVSTFGVATGIAALGGTLIGAVGATPPGEACA
ncbi:RHS repeat-associated core domain-containing protein [Actinokineospora fastidiosa]|uniref:RHS repeat-associated core domain-containing protein n=1 Tax=Actinokineospora fastidiosa TaxID=1816 RepID=UPI003570EADA